ncbi:hypothetical protein KSU13_09250 [Fusobacterium nucleatum]|uniref:hypothetical protein n=1 Tax=Fusobacterium nucleatum TaxID=851 RepID=UPI0030D48808
MEKEKVLEIEIIKATDKYSYWVIRKVNKIKLKKMPLTEIAHEDKKKYCFGYGYINEFKKEYIGYNHHSCVSDYQIDLEIDNLESYDKPYLIENKLVPDLQFLIDVVNEKYGIPNRWRADDGERYYYIDSHQRILDNTDLTHSYDDMRYELGNYFQTKEEAQKVIDSKEWQDFWAKVRAGEIGGDE